MFSKTVNLNNREEMIKYLSNHFRYNTANSWNLMTSYANNVKLYKLDLPDISKAYDFLNAKCEEYIWDIDNEIREFQVETGYTAGFNGRSGGYIVLYDTTRDENGIIRTILHEIDKYEDFEDWDDNRLKARVELVQRFDELCDTIRDIFIEYVNNSVIKTVPVTSIRYETIAVRAGTDGKNNIS